MHALGKFLPVLLMVGLLPACVSTAPNYDAYVADPEPQRQLATEVYYYPMQGQSIKQQDRDRYECYLWAKQQTGFEPSQPYLAPHQRTYLVPDPEPGRDTVAGAVTGAALGAIIGAPHSTGEGALIGALAGGMLGAASDSVRQERTKTIQDAYDRSDTLRYAGLERQADNYRRAMKACLAGRGYSVR
jgi:hypothetical protein